MSDDTSEQGGKKVAAPHRNPMSRDEDSTRTRNVISPSQFPLNDPLTKKRFEVLEKEIKAQNDMIHQTEDELSFKMTCIQSLLESVCKFLALRTQKKMDKSVVLNDGSNAFGMLDEMMQRCTLKHCDDYFKTSPMCDDCYGDNW